MVSLQALLMYMNEQKLIPKDKFDLVTTEDSIWKRTDERSVAAMKASAGEVYTVYNQYLKRYTACQVAYIAPPDTVSKESWAVVLSLDWVGDAPLTAEELPHLRPLYKDFMYWSRDLHLLRVPMEVPPQYMLVGTLPPFTDQPCRSYGGWSDGYDVYLQIRW